MNKKAQGISIEVIIIVAIALLVLVILAVIFVGKLGVFGVKVGECTNKGGKCTVNACGAAGTDAADYPTPIDWACTAAGEHCCIKVAV